MHSQKITVWYLMWYICLCTHLYVPIHTLPWFYTQWWRITPHHYFAYLFVAEFCYIAQAGLRLTM